MKLKTKINDLKTLIAATAATAKAACDAAALTAAIASGQRDRAIAALDLSLASRSAATAAVSTFGGLPPARRELAEHTRSKAEALGRSAAELGGDYSGTTEYRVTWTDFAAPTASTATGRGEKYSSSCKYSKTDADHIVTLSPEWSVLLAERADVAALSVRDGLPLVGWHADGRVCWVRAKGKGIAEKVGWIAHFGAVCYHSEKSQADADHGLARKLAAVRAEWVSQAEARAKSAQWARDERRARLVARLCDVSATLADALALGFCRPGIEAFQARHGIGDSAPLRTLIATGDASAMRLALAVARRVRRNPETMAA